MGSQERETAVEIDAASTDHLDPDTVDRPEEVPWEPWKTVQAFVFFVCGSVLFSNSSYICNISAIYYDECHTFVIRGSGTSVRMSSSIRVH